MSKPIALARPMVTSQSAMPLRGRHHLAHALDAALGIGEGAVLFEEGRARQEDMGVVGGLVQEQVLDDDAFHRRQRRHHVLGVGVGLQDVLALDIEALEGAVDGGVEHVGNAQARLRVELDVPHRLEHGRAPHRRRCGDSPAVRAGTSPCRRSPARCSGRAAGSRRRRGGRYCRSPWRGWRSPSPWSSPGCAR